VNQIYVPYLEIDQWIGTRSPIHQMWVRMHFYIYRWKGSDCEILS